jgi:hypothetical protein
MNAGQTDIKVGTRVVLKNIKGEDGELLNGLTGTVTHPFAFGCTKKGWVGIRLEGGKAIMPYGGQCNVKVSELEIVD